MVFDKVGTTSIVSQENVSIANFLENLEKRYEKISNDNIIIDLFSFDELSSGNVLEFLSLSEKHKNGNKSFILVTDKIGYDDAPDAIDLVPTLQEAHDIIYMEEIERDLGI